MLNSEELNTSEQYDDLSVSLTYSVNLNTQININLNDSKSDAYASNIFKIENFKCLNCAKDMIFYRDNESERYKIYDCNFCGNSMAPNSKGIVLCPSCGFCLCNKCRFCNNGHKLGKIYELKFDNKPLFIKKNYEGQINIDINKCEICSKIKKNEFPLFICWTCNYIVCNTCMLKTKGSLS